jgi:hypothetical protein
MCQDANPPFAADGPSLCQQIKSTRMPKARKQKPYETSLEFSNGPTPPDASGDYDRFGILLKESQKFCKRVGLQKDLIPTIIKTDSDWAFILTVDALLESAAKHIVRHGLQIQLLKRTFRNGALDDFIDSLSMNGRTSLLKLLEASALPEEELRFVEVTRMVRNAYAHNIEYADLSLTQLINSRGDKSRLIKYLSGIKTYDETDLMASYEKDPIFLRFCIIDSVMRFMFYAYHLTSKPKKAANRKATK